MFMGNHGFMGGFMWIFWIVAIVGLVFLVKWIVQQNSVVRNNPELNSLEILRNRYARGEIDKEEFEQKRKDMMF